MAEFFQKSAGSYAQHCDRAGVKRGGLALVGISSVLATIG